MEREKVRLTREGPVAWVQIHNPERYNALSRQLIEELGAAVRQLAVSREVRALIIHGGEAKAFCTGADLKERQGLSEPQVIQMVHALREAVNGYARLPMPVIENLVEHLGSLQRILRASIEELDEVEGIGEVRARAIKEGLRRLREQIMLERHI